MTDLKGGKAGLGHGKLLSHRHAIHLAGHQILLQLGHLRTQLPLDSFGTRSGRLGGVVNLAQPLLRLIHLGAR